MINKGTKFNLSLDVMYSDEYIGIRDSDEDHAFFNSKMPYNTYICICICVYAWIYKCVYVYRDGGGNKPIELSRVFPSSSFDWPTVLLELKFESEVVRLARASFVRRRASILYVALSRLISQIELSWPKLESSASDSAHCRLPYTTHYTHPINVEYAHIRAYS